MLANIPKIQPNTPNKSQIFTKKNFSGSLHRAKIRLFFILDKIHDAHSCF
ncbi:hypothetical protein HMPREF0476_0372 [Kingella kingae ATCC 23330]|uniref:Uncharacterized protein n=1 Tax=Kingella kingae ATCC 23330 TaxID=887327 RepID=F5S589_KINKI|nr:hypothetical protein HMPREF0476_0372 [Kingella kingae ATCC 23330]